MLRGLPYFTHHFKVRVFEVLTTNRKRLKSLKWSLIIVFSKDYLQQHSRLQLEGYWDKTGFATGAQNLCGFIDAWSWSLIWLNK